MSERSSHGHAKRQPSPLRQPTRVESRRDQRTRRSWRARKLTVVFAAMPVVVIGIVGIAMANPGGNNGAAGCSTTTSSAIAGTATGAVTAGSNAGNYPGGNSVGHGGGRHHHPTGPATSAAASTSATGTTATGTTTTTTGTGTTTTTSGSTTSTTTTTTTTTATPTTAACPTASATTAATPDPNCTIIVPANPLSAAGLMTPYQLTATDPAMGPCDEANVGAQSAFVEAAILSPDGQLTTYDPVVVNQGAQPFSPPANPQLPDGATVALWFGFNGTNLTLQSAAGTDSINQANCVNGAQGSIFTQVAYCNAPAFFTLANQEIGNNTLQVPPLGTASDGQPCPTTRSFALVDQDQSDNVVSTYLVNGNGQIAQDNAAAMAAADNNATAINNGSDNFLLDQFVDPALGCSNYTRPNESEDGMPVGGLALDELSAAAFQQAPIALVPLNDPMTLDNAGNADTNKSNLFRAGVDQPLIGTAAGGDGSGTTYCQDLFQNPAGIQRVFNLDTTLFSGKAGPDPAEATNLFTFLAMRAQQSFTNLNCGPLLNENNPITLTVDGNGVTTAASFNANPGPFSTAAAPNPTIAGTTATTPAGAMTTAPSTTPATTPATTPTSNANPNANSNSNSTGTAFPSLTPSGTGHW